MKNSAHFLVVLILSVFLFTSCSQKPITCTIKGTITGQKTDTLIIVKSGAHPDIAEAIAPIIDGKFQFTLTGPCVEAYDINVMEESTSKIITFFNDRRNIRCELHPFEKDKQNIISGGRLNRELARLKQMEVERFASVINPIDDRIQVLANKGEFYSKSLDTLYGELDTIRSLERQKVLWAKLDEMKRTGTIFTPEGRILNAKSDSVYTAKDQWYMGYYAKNISLVSYNLLLRDYRSAVTGEADTVNIHRLLPLFMEKFPDHPFTSVAANMLEGEKKIRVGGQFIDFTLPDLSGKEYTLSDLIRGKVAIIDLWATTCGPCIRHNQSFVPVYQEFKDMGFTIVGVAGELNNTDRLVKHLNQEKYPWINLVELDYKHGVWNKYFNTNVMGKTVLVDKEGRVLAINLLAEDVRAKLIELLGTPE
jgi:thiol-disulfide isomerase/thioredoxin